MHLTKSIAAWLKRRTPVPSEEPWAGPRICVLNSLIGMPTTFATKAYEAGTEAELYFLDYNYIDRIKTPTCLSELAQARIAHQLDFGSKTLLLAAKGLHPAPDALIALAHEFRAHHVFVELWNGLKEVVQLAEGRLDRLYFLPVAPRLTQPGAPQVPEQPNRRVFVSLGGDDDLDLIREVIARCPHLHFCLPDVSWAKPGSEKRFFDVRMTAANVSAVSCAAVRDTQQLSFSAEYQAAYRSCDTVLIATAPDKMFQMRGGVRVADALHARKHIVMTENPLCQLVMAQHERTCLVAEHDPDRVAAHLTRIGDGGFRVDEATYEAVRQLTPDEHKLPWMIGAAEDPERASRSVFARDPDLIEATRRSLFARGRELLESEVQEVRRSRRRD